uniref:Uncharacterized protein n=1 Tax=viral metagenome TaxID=1070528 RepID=A0A6C0C846_9ZZZZ
MEGFPPTNKYVPTICEDSYENYWQCHEGQHVEFLQREQIDDELPTNFRDKYEREKYSSLRVDGKEECD